MEGSGGMSTNASSVGMVFGALVFLVAAFLVSLRYFAYGAPEALGFLFVPFLVSAVPVLVYYRVVYPRLRHKKVSDKRIWLVVSIWTFVLTLVLVNQ